METWHIGLQRENTADEEHNEGQEPTKCVCCVCHDGHVLYVSRSLGGGGSIRSGDQSKHAVVRWDFRDKGYDTWKISDFNWPVQSLSLGNLSGTTKRLATRDGSFSSPFIFANEEYRFVFRTVVWQFESDSSVAPRMLAIITPLELFRDQPHDIAAQLFGRQNGYEVELWSHEISGDARYACASAYAATYPSIHDGGCGGRGDDDVGGSGGDGVCTRACVRIYPWPMVAQASPCSLRDSASAAGYCA